jgi:uncharacterized protein YdhG (YjbR/CyaY superfamily)
MKESSATTIDQYFSNLEPEDKKALQRIHQIVKEVVPEAEESISYQMPAFKLNGKPLIYFGAFKDHLSIFPTSGPIARLEPKLKKFKVAKGTIQFTPQDQVPKSIIVSLLKERIKQINK